MDFEKDCNVSEEDLEKKAQEYCLLLHNKKTIADKIVPIKKLFERAIKRDCRVGDLTFSVREYEVVDWKRMALDSDLNVDCYIYTKKSLKITERKIDGS